ncbi:MAG: hypothetical protein WDZ77_01795 [Candidatus Pacearchaeota archaeon]
MVDSVVPIEKIFKDPGLINATRELTRSSMLDNVREGVIYVLWKGLVNQPFNLVGGFAEGNRMYLRLRSENAEGIMDVCELPEVYNKRFIDKVHPFDEGDIKKILLKSGIYPPYDKFYLR